MNRLGSNCSRTLKRAGKGSPVKIGITAALVSILTSSCLLAATAAQPVEGLTPISKAIPERVYPPKGQRWTQVKADAANDHWRAIRGNYWIHSDWKVVNTWKVCVWSYFDEAEKDKLAVLNTGDSVTVQGTIVRCEVVDFGKDGWILSIDLGKCHLVKK